MSPNKRSGYLVCRVVANKWLSRCQEPGARTVLCGLQIVSDFAFGLIGTETAPLISQIRKSRHHVSIRQAHGNRPVKGVRRLIKRIDRDDVSLALRPDLFRQRLD